MERRRVAVTGLGVVAPCGLGTDAFFEGLHGPPPEGEQRVLDFDPAPLFDNPKQARRADRFTQFALEGARQALAEAGELSADPARIGSLIGTGVGGIETLENQIEIMLTKGPKRVSPFLVPMLMANAAAASVSMRYGFQGPCETTVTACAAGTMSIGNAARLIAFGYADAMVAGGTEATMSPVSRQGFINMTATSSSGRSRPFDVNRDGFLHAEGCGILVLEELEAARARGATIIAEILGSGSTADAHHITAPAPGGAGAVRCLEVALEDAGLAAADISHINAHGTSTPLNDAAEAEAIAKVFGSPGPLVTSIKGITGHSLAAAGALEAVAVALCMRHGRIPPTVGYETPDPELAPINLVLGEAIEWDAGPTLSNSFGFGGHNACLAMGPPPA